jgi:VWFA-related protein
MKGRARAAALVVAIVLIGAAAHAETRLDVRVQRVDAQAYPTIRAFVLVRGEDGQTIPGLSAGDFTVEDSGAAPASLQASSMLSGTERIAVVLALDRSGSMKGEPFAAAMAAARDFAARMNQQDALTAITFSTRVDPFPDLTTDRVAALSMLGARRCGGNTALNDAVSTAVSVLAACDADRKAVVVLTDGKDNASRTSVKDCAIQATGAGVTVYCVAFGPSVNEDALAGLADATGGEAFLVGNLSGVQPVYQRIARELRNEYVLTYRAPDSQDAGAWRTLTLTAKLNGQTGSDQWQYMVPRPGAAAPSTGVGAELAMMVVGGLLVVANAALVAALVRRKRRAERADWRV